MNNLLLRSITGLGYVLIMVFATLFDQITYTLLYGIVMGLCLWEFYTLIRNHGVYPNKWLGLLLAVSIYMFAVFLFFGIKTRIPLSLVFLFSASIFFMELFSKKEKPFDNIAYTIVGVIYIALPLSLTLFIANPYTDTIYFNPVYMLGVLIISWTNDTFAYLVGVKFGKHRLFERISPKKSWEGFLGGLVAVQIASQIIGHYTTTSLTPIDCAMLGLIISVIGTLGDLIESMLKRQYNVKDSGTLLPGHGGMLDRFDIILFVTPFVFIYLFLRLN
ncbi:MAG: phosphatidate cytidylyltransferase [Bacteroidales bacterium]|jgi:phosphatidate cytidylyltransferase|nr:phosphatidate cytidylyltransferase [Bacteroidales bacterium]